MEITIVPHVYHKISFEDNGIGFEPDHTEKIFGLFQRLHDQSKYSGTGLGLAICKKVIENKAEKLQQKALPAKVRDLIFFCRWNSGINRPTANRQPPTVYRQPPTI